MPRLRRKTAAIVAEASVRRRRPRRRRQAALAVGGQVHVGGVELHAIPELAGDLLVVLVEAFTVIGELAAPHEVAEAETNLAKPVGIRERLPGSGHEIGFTAREDALGLVERPDAAAGDDWRGEAGVAHRAADPRGQRHIAAEGTTLVR